MTKYMYNGIKQDGKLYRCWYSFGGHITSKTAITIYAYDYTHLPICGLEIKNNTDTMTDYFETDRATINIEHPLYTKILLAAIKAEIHKSKRYANKINMNAIQTKIAQMQNLYNSLNKGVNNE